jgi:hypothetical protein
MKAPSRVILAAAVCMAFPMTTMAQLVYNVDPPSNTSCENALVFCTSFTYNWSTTEVGNVCMFFRFVVPETMQVNIDVQGTTQDVQWYGDIDPAAPCPAEVQCEVFNPNLPIDQVLQPGVYYIVSKFKGRNNGSLIVQVNEGELCAAQVCEGCLPSFSPLEEKEYLVNAWVRKSGNILGVTHYSDVRITVECPPGELAATVLPIGHVIDGWQLMEGTFETPLNPAAVRLTLFCDAGTAYFDDVRLLPADASMKSYVYDPENLRFVAELDERHFATLYEYDNEGKLVRVKKETERGIMTVQETRENASHHP